MVYGGHSKAAGFTIDLAKLDDFIFNKFLIKKIKVFYSMDELKNYSYDKMEHLSTKV